MILVPLLEMTSPICNPVHCRSRCDRNWTHRRMREAELFRKFVDIFLDGTQTESKEEKDESVKKIFHIPLKIKGYTPQEIAVKISDGKVNIHGKHEETREDGSFASREFRREFTIPTDVDPETIEAQIDSDGLLSIKAHVKIPEIKQIELKRKEETSTEVNEDGNAENSVDVQKIPEIDRGDIVSVKKENIVTVQTEGFTPEEITVKIRNGNAYVCAKHEEQESGSFVYREFRREFPIPPEVDPNSIVAEINEDGLLNIRGSPKLIEAKNDVVSDQNATSQDKQDEVSLEIKVSVPENPKTVQN